MRALGINLAISTVMLVGFSTPVWAAAPSQILGVWKCSTIQDMGEVQLETNSSDNYLPGGKLLSVGRINIKVNEKPMAAYDFRGSSDYELKKDRLVGTIERVEVQNVMNPEFERMAKLIDQLESKVGQKGLSSVIQLDKSSFVYEESASQTLTACSRK